MGQRIIFVCAPLGMHRLENLGHRSRMQLHFVLITISLRNEIWLPLYKWSLELVHFLFADVKIMPLTVQDTGVRNHHNPDLIVAVKLALKNQTYLPLVQIPKPLTGRNFHLLSCYQHHPSSHLHPDRKDQAPSGRLFDSNFGFCKFLSVITFSIDQRTNAGTKN